MDWNSILATITATHPAWFALIAAVAYIVKSKIGGTPVSEDAMVEAAEEALDPEHPLKARLKQKAGETYEDLVASGNDEDDTYKYLLDQLRVAPEGK